MLVVNMPGMPDTEDKSVSKQMELYYKIENFRKHSSTHYFFKYLCERWPGFLTDNRGDVIDDIAYVMGQEDYIVERFIHGDEMPTSAELRLVVEYVDGTNGELIFLIQSCLHDQAVTNVYAAALSLYRLKMDDEVDILLSCNKHLVLDKT